MDKTLFKDVHVSQRAGVLKDNCDAVESIDYAKAFTPEEIEVKKGELADLLIRRSKLEQELAEIKQEFKEKIKPLSDGVVENIEDIKFGSRVVTEDCYKFVYPEEKQVAYFNGEGDCIKTRPMLPAEAQGTLMKVLREGTNN